MAALNPKARELAVKVVYYGPGLGGKTSTLEALHRTTVPERRGKLLSLATPVDRTLFFDFLPLRPEIQRAPGAPPESVPSVRLQLFTVPGQVYFNATRKLVLTGADGVVFVADSQVDRMDANLESLENLRENLREHGRNVDEVPLALQYNKRDLPRIATIEELDRVLNPKKLPSFGTSAVRGDGIREALDRVLSDVLAKLGTRDVVPRSRSSTHNIAIRAVEGGLSEEIARAADLARRPAVDLGPDEANAPLTEIPPAAGVSFATLFEDQGRELAGDVERLITTRRFADAVRADNTARRVAPVAVTPRAVNRFSSSVIARCNRPESVPSLHPSSRAASLRLRPSR